MSRRRHPARAVLLALVLAVSIGACSSDDDGGGNGSAGAESSDVSGQRYVMVTFLSGIEFWKPAREGMEAAAEQLGVEASYQGTPEYSAPDQVAVLEQVAASSPDGILVTAQNPDALKNPIAKIIESGIDVVMFDSDAPESGRQTIVAVDNQLGGAQAADTLAELSGGEGSVGIITTPGQFNLDQRQKGFEDRIKERYPGLEVVEVADALDDYNTAAAAASGFIQAHDDLVGIFSTGSSGGPGSVQALKEAGKLEDVTVVGFDIDEATIAGIEKNEIAATIVQGAYCMGYWGMQQLFAVHNDRLKPVDNPEEAGIPVLPTSTDCGVFPVTKENVGAFK